MATKHTRTTVCHGESRFATLQEERLGPFSIARLRCQRTGSQVNLVSNQHVLAIVTASNHRLAARFVSTIFFAGQIMERLESHRSGHSLIRAAARESLPVCPGKPSIRRSHPLKKWQGTSSTQSDDTQRPVQTRVRARCSISVHHPNLDMTRSLYRR